MVHSASATAAAPPWAGQPHRAGPGSQARPDHKAAWRDQSVAMIGEAGTRSARRYGEVAGFYAQA